MHSVCAWLGSGHRCVAARFQKQVRHDLGSAAVGHGLRVEPTAIVATLGAALGRRAARTRPVAAGTVHYHAVADVSVVRQTYADVVVNPGSTRTVQPNVHKQYSNTVHQHHNTLSLSLCFNVHFPGEPGLA